MVFRTTETPSLSHFGLQALMYEECSWCPSYHADTDIEFNFDFQKNREVLRKVKVYCDSNRVPYYNFEIRTTKEDDAMLSCCHGRDAMWIDFQAKAHVSRDFFDEMEQLLKPIGFRKHWAKGMIIVIQSMYHSSFLKSKNS